APTATPAPMAVHSPQPYWRRSGVTTPARLMTEPTDRSIPPARITKASPTAAAVLKAKLRATFMRLVVLKKRGAQTLTATMRSARERVTPNSYVPVTEASRDGPRDAREVRSSS